MTRIGILMLHGFTALPEQFSELAEFFSEKGFMVSVPAIAGHTGNPNDLRNTNTEDWKNSVKQAYVELKQSTNKIFIIGNSFGANLAFWLAREFNNEQAGIITLGAPIWLKYHYFILLRLNTYGLFRRNYKKPRRVYRSPWAFVKCFFTKKNQDLPWAPILSRCDREIIPTKSFRYFLNFIKKDTRTYLCQVKTPVLVVHSSTDTVVLPKSAQFIYNNIGSENKKLYWFESNKHVIMRDEKRIKLFKKIHKFINEFS